jgi:glycosyltransferase involved in cell wall biosynthesis
MKENLLLSNVFVSPSSIENSPNSICEAQMLGVPIVASFVGGVPDFIPTKNFGLTYRFEDVEMLAQKICECFETSKIFDSTLMVETARKRHNKAENLRVLIDIYKTIADEND